jgi:hypothetical protein
VTSTYLQSIRCAGRSIAIEAKDFEIARARGEIANEVEKLFVGNNGKKSTAELHLRRVESLRQQTNEVFTSFGVQVGQPQA